MKFNHSFFVAGFLALLFLSCMDTKGPDRTGTNNGDINLSWSGSLNQECDSGQLHWVIRLDGDTSGTEEYTLPVGASLDSVYVGASFEQGLASILIDSVHSDHVYGTFEVYDTGVTAVITGRFTLEKVLEAPSCEESPGLACSDSLPSIQLEGEWTWASQPSSVKRSLNSVTWTGERLVAVGDSGTILTSPGGAEWTGQVSGTSLPLLDVTCSHAGVVTVGDSGVILRSDDGLTWSVATSGTQHALRAVEWRGGRYVAAGDSGILLTSVDGVFWNTESSGVTVALRAISASSDKVVVVGNEGTALISTNGGAWQQRSVGASNPGLYAVVWTGAHFMAYGGSSPPPTFYMLKSPDGSDWENTMSLPHFFRAKFVGNHPAGISAEPLNTPTKFVVRFSADSGTTWTSRDIPNFPEFISVRDFAWTGERLVVVGYRGGILTLP